MKLSKYVALAKRGYCKVIHVQNSGIWLGLKCAIYRAVELPDIHGEGQARAVLDIPEKAWGNTFFEEENAEGEQILYVKEKDYGPMPKSGKLIRLDKKRDYFVKECSLKMGVYRMELERVR